MYTVHALNRLWLWVCVHCTMMNILFCGHRAMWIEWIYWTYSNWISISRRIQSVPRIMIQNAYCMWVNDLGLFIHDLNLLICFSQASCNSADIYWTLSKRHHRRFFFELSVNSKSNVWWVVDCVCNAARNINKGTRSVFTH